MNTEMSSVKKTHPRGVITSHTSFPVSLLKIEESIAAVEEMTEKTKSLSQPNVRTKGSCRPAKKNEGKQSSKQDRLSYTSLGQMQAQIEAEKQEAQQLIQCLLDKENNFMKELECFLNQQDVAKQRRKEFFHKRWAERVWLPLQRKVEEDVSSGWPLENRRQSLYSHYLRHCNSKGFVFLETYNLQEYNPFLLISKPQHFKGCNMSSITRNAQEKENVFLL